MQLLSKSAFAREIGVSPGRITQMISEGKIGADALEGQGVHAQIRVDVARRQIGDRTDLGQRFGNGIDTRLEAAIAPANDRDETAEAIKTEKLLGLQLANRRLREEALARQGLYTRTDQVAGAMNKLAANLIGVFEGSLSDLAQAVAARFQLPARDVLHVLRGELREIRAKAAATARGHADDLPRLVDHEIADAADPAAGEA